VCPTAPGCISASFGKPHSLRGLASAQSLDVPINWLTSNVLQIIADSYELVHLARQDLRVTSIFWQASVHFLAVYTLSWINAARSGTYSSSQRLISILQYLFSDIRIVG
jgi:hypothetical protein